MSKRYIAGRDLYDGARVRFAEGEAVPADAFPQVATESLLANGGLRAFRAEHSGDQALITAVPEGGEVEPDPSDDPGVVDTKIIGAEGGYAVVIAAGEPIRLHSLNAPASKARIREVRNPSALDQLEAAERAHPDYDGGRTSVLNAIEAQRQRLLEADDG